jgi:hypothetical protein
MPSPEASAARAAGGRRDPACGTPAGITVHTEPAEHSAEKQAMKCPVCPETTLLMTDRQGVEIDYCPQCRGVWLDRGELDKLVALGAKHDTAASPSAASPPPPRGRPQFEDSDFGKRYGGHRRKSWLSDIFD